MKSSNLWRIIWVVGIYAVLALILYLVVLYKVQWEYKDLNTYLYFYNCNGSLCTSSTGQNDYYSKVLCEEEMCPYVTNIIDNNLILEDGNTACLYNYINGQIVNNSYDNYRYIGNDIFVVTNVSKKQGVIDLDSNVLVQPKYDYIDDYDNGFVSYKLNNLYGIDTVDEKYSVNADFEDIVLINDNIFAGMKNNLYHIYSYDDIDGEDSREYNFVATLEDIIFVISNKKIDILDYKLDSTLLMKIDTFYEYTTEKERGSLELHSDGKNIYFKVFVSEKEYVLYEYNIKDKKLV